MIAKASYVFVEIIKKTEAIHTARLITEHALLLATGKSAQGLPHVCFRDALERDLKYVDTIVDE